VLTTIKDIPWDLKSLETARSRLSQGSAQRGKVVYGQGRVVSCRGDKSGTDYKLAVRKDSSYTRAAYRVELTYARGFWTYSCACYNSPDCKHIYAALLHLENECKNTHPAARPPPAGFFALFPEGKAFSNREKQYLERLENLYHRHQSRLIIYGHELQELIPGWSLGQSWLEQHFAPAGKLSRQQFWHFLVDFQRQRGLTPPDFFEALNDTTPSQDLIENWKHSQEVSAWNARFARKDLPRGDLDFRWVLQGDSIHLEVRFPAEPFRKLRGGELTTLTEQYRHAQVRMCAGALPLFSEHVHRFPYQPEVNLKLTRVCGEALNRLLRFPDVRERFIVKDGHPPVLTEDTVRWRMDEPVERPRFYRFQLLVNDAPATQPVLIFPGANALYLIEDRLASGPPPPFPLDNVSCLPATDVPKDAVESADAIAYLLACNAGLPERLNARVKCRQLRAVVNGRVDVELSGGKPAAYYSVVLKDPDTGKTVATYREMGWDCDFPQIVRNGKQFVCYEPPNLASLHESLASLPATFDYHRQSWRVKNPKQSFALFAEWARNLPPEVELEVDENLAGLREAPLELDIALGCSEAIRDWFDLRLALSDAEIELTPDELKALLRVRGQTVQLPEHRYRPIRVHVDEELESLLDELGLTLPDLAGDPQRLHIGQLQALLKARLLPESIRPHLQQRLSELQIQVRPGVPASIQAALRPYQRTGFHFLAFLATNRFGGILADDMGLGKTVQALTWLAWLFEPSAPGGDGGPALIVCPKSVVDNWVAEAHRFYPGLPISRLEKTKLDSIKPSLQVRSALVVNYTQLRLCIAELKLIHWSASIFDEGQYLKNPQSQTAQSARELVADHKVVLTGTPIENSLLDLWSLMQCVMPGMLGSQARFKRTYIDDDDQLSCQRVARRIRPFLLRRTKEEVAPELPPRVEEDIRCEMEGTQHQLYQAELKLARQQLLNIRSHAELDQHRFNLLTSLLRLRQICCHPALIDKTAGTETSAKLEALLEMLEPLLQEGNKVLVFSQFVDMLELIETQIKAAKWTSFKLTGATRQRAKVIESFDRHAGGAVFLISLKAGGAGLNLAAASYVVLYDPWWNPAVEAQAIDRTHRIGQTRTVFAYRLLMRETIEDKIRQLQTYKSALAKNVLGEEGFARALTLDDFKYLLG